MPRKKKTGRPLDYPTAAKLQKAIDSFFDNTPVPTVNGLALYLGFYDRHSIYDYKERPAFSPVVKRALMRMEDYYEKKLSDPDAKPAGVIFWLKNHKWSDRTEVAHSGELNVIRLPAKKRVGEKPD